MKLIIGLGNPGLEYKNTRHNIGFVVVDELAERLGISFKKRSSAALVAKGEIEGKPVILVKPQTFVNLSGGAVRMLIDYFKLVPSDIVVVHDDLDLDFGRIQVKTRGGAGGHNGVTSIIDSFKTDIFLRVRVGISRPDKDAVDYVLESFSNYERKTLGKLVDKAILALECIVTRPVSEAMNKFNQKETQ